MLSPWDLVAITHWEMVVTSTINFVFHSCEVYNITKSTTWCICISTFHCSVCTKLGKWTVMFLCVRVSFVLFLGYFYWTLELFQQCDIVDISSNCNFKYRYFLFLCIWSFRCNILMYCSLFILLVTLDIYELCSINLIVLMSII
jgi:hypothetical protein